MLGIQITSGILVGMTYVASDDYSFTTLDILYYYSYPTPYLCSVS